MRSFVEAGLKDVSISRKTIKWGIPWPDDPEHVFYVWYDALTSYMSGIGYGEGADGEANPQFKKYWPADLHMIGKEIIRFHAVYWPAFLMAAGLPLPETNLRPRLAPLRAGKDEQVQGQRRLPEPIVKAFDELTGAKVGNDALRYYLLRETVFGQDGNFSREALITRYNADLANGLGNLASRVLTMIESYFGGIVPDRAVSAGKSSASRSADAMTGIAVRTYYDRLPILEWRSKRFGRFISLVDAYLLQQKPWKQDQESPKSNGTRREFSMTLQKRFVLSRFWRIR